MLRNPHRILFLILILAAVLRLVHLRDSSFWLDEFCSVECSTGRGLAHVALPQNQWLTAQPRLTSLHDAPAWWHVWTSLRLDNHPPLYFLLLRFWRDAFGEGDAAARLLSVLISLAGICFLFDAVKSGLGPGAALWAALLAAIAMPQIHFGQEARGYGLLGALGMAACAALVRIEAFGPNRRRLVALAAAMLGMFLTHYFALAGAAALALYAILALRGKARGRALLAMLAAAVLFALAWGPWLVQQRHSFAVNNAWQIEHSNRHLAQTFLRAAFLPVRWCSQSLADRAPGLSAWIGLAAFALAVCRFRGRQRLWGLWMIFPILLVAAVDLVHQSHLLDSIRYTVAGSWGLYVIVAGRARAWHAHILPAAVSLLCAVSIPASYSQSRDWQTLADFLQANVQPDDTVVFASAGRDDWYAGAMYLGVCHYARPLPAPMLLLTRPLTPDLIPRLKASRTIWLIAGSSVPADQIIPGATVLDSADFPDIGKIWKLRLTIHGAGAAAPLPAASN